MWLSKDAPTESRREARACHCAIPTLPPEFKDYTGGFPEWPPDWRCDCCGRLWSYQGLLSAVPMLRQPRKTVEGPDGEHWWTFDRPRRCPSIGGYRPGCAHVFVMPPLTPDDCVPLMAVRRVADDEEIRP